MLIFWRLLLAHLLADFPLQTDRVANFKRTSRKWMLLHCLTHAGLSAVLIWPYINEIWFTISGFRFYGWMAVAVILLTHYLQDMWRVYAIRKLHSHDGVLYFLWDQIVHIGILFALAAPALGDGSALPEKWVLMACLFTIITYGNTILSYFLDKTLYNAEFPRFDAKYFLMLQRAALWLFFLIPGWRWIPWATAWAGYSYYLRKRRILDLSRAGFYSGLGVTLIAGIMARNLYLGG
ncbi:MAG: DUF3307 domain-containing protein [Elusimicrobiaceae bacterium]|nr:DUF3307 domain-containing protein [Elusimicrobiaceae bacterium]